MHLAGKEAGVEDLGLVASGDSTRTVHLPDLARPEEVRVDLLQQGRDRAVATWRGVWQPQRKWKIYSVSYSHHDLGFGNYPHRLRTEIGRELNVSEEELKHLRYGAIFALVRSATTASTYLSGSRYFCATRWMSAAVTALISTGYLST